MQVYALGVMQIEYDHRSKDEDPPSFIIKTERLWGLYSSFELAEDAILNNRGDLFEYYYNLGLIEEVTVLGNDTQYISTFPKNRWWYLAEYEKNLNGPFGLSEPKISKIDCPDFFKNIFNFWVG